MTRRIVLVAPACLALLVGCGGSGDSSLGTGSALPDVTLPALGDGGEPLALADLEGPAVVNLWATWCGPCRAELPAFQEASVAHPDVRFVGVDIGEDAPEALAFLDDIGVDTDVFSQYGDPDAALTDALATTALPVTILVDGDDRIADIHLGPLTVDDLTTAITDL
jgi:thiol-disulfide isomerase/thioredoxin